jgi:hypothetical protein
VASKNPPSLWVGSRSDSHDRPSIELESRGSSGELWNVHFSRLSATSSAFRPFGCSRYGLFESARSQRTVTPTDSARGPQANT